MFSNILVRKNKKEYSRTLKTRQIYEQTNSIGSKNTLTKRNKVLEYSVEIFLKIVLFEFS